MKYLPNIQQKELPKQNQHAVEYLMQSMNLDKSQAEAALGLDAE